jgi:ribosomal protein L11 methyltransferase
MGARLPGQQPSGWSYRLSPQLVLRTGWEPQGTEPGERVLRLRPGGAFPLGHPTTRLCLDVLREVLATASASSLLDVGCGTGLLGLAAAALGVPRVVGVDLAPGAAQVTRENARENGFAGVLTVVQGSTECVKVPFDLVIANLPWEVQMHKVSELNRLAASRGRLILSGFRDNQEDLLTQSYQRLGWSLERRLTWDFRHPELPPDISFTWVAWLMGKATV